MSDSLWPMDCGPPGFSVHGILQERILEWVAIPFSRGSSQPRDGTQVSSIAGGFFTIWAPRETHTTIQWIVLAVSLGEPCWTYKHAFGTELVHMWGTAVSAKAAEDHTSQEELLSIIVVIHRLKEISTVWSSYKRNSELVKGQLAKLREEIESRSLTELNTTLKATTTSPNKHDQKFNQGVGEQVRESYRCGMEENGKCKNDRRL